MKEMDTLTLGGKDYEIVDRLMRDKSGLSSDIDTVALLAEADMIPATYNTNNKILTDENGKVILRY